MICKNHASEPCVRPMSRLFVDPELGLISLLQSQVNSQSDGGAVIVFSPNPDRSQPKALTPFTSSLWDSWKLLQHSMACCTAWISSHVAQGQVEVRATFGYYTGYTLTLTLTLTPTLTRGMHALLCVSAPAMSHMVLCLPAKLFIGHTCMAYTPPCIWAPPAKLFAPHRNHYIRFIMTN